MTEPPQQSFRLELPHFEGPLDLLLHLIEEHKLDIFDIPIAFIAERYLEYLDGMGIRELESAGEYLVMAATLAQIKSRMLLPPSSSPASDDPAEEGPDPRQALVLRLLTYQKYKDAAARLGAGPMLGRDAFARGGREPLPLVPLPGAEALGLMEVTPLQLVAALHRALKDAAPEVQHEVYMERVRIADRISEIADRLKLASSLRFSELLASGGDRSTALLVATFLAVLEMARLGLLRVHQAADGATGHPLGEIYIMSSERPVEVPSGAGDLGYAG